MSRRVASLLDPSAYTIDYCDEVLRQCPEGCAALYLMSKGRQLHHRFNKSKGGDIRRLSRSGAAVQLNALKGAAR